MSRMPLKKGPWKKTIAPELTTTPTTAAERMVLAAIFAMGTFDYLMPKDAKQIAKMMLHDPYLTPHNAMRHFLGLNYDTPDDNYIQHKAEATRWKIMLAKDKFTREKITRDWPAEAALVWDPDPSPAFDPRWADVLNLETVGKFRRK